MDDVNDNEPIFKPYQSSISVREDSQPDILTTVEATDADEGPYGQVKNYCILLRADFYTFFQRIAFHRWFITSKNWRTKKIYSRSQR